MITQKNKKIIKTLFFCKKEKEAIWKSYINKKNINRYIKKNTAIEKKKIKVIGNFFKLKYKKKKKIIKFNLCLAHKMYIIKNSKDINVIKHKKNKLFFFWKKNKNIKKNIETCLAFLKKKRGINIYTKKGVKDCGTTFKNKIGKKTTYS